MTRRPKGDGAIFQRKDGMWVARYEVAGKRKYLYGKNKKTVAEKLKERLSSGMVDLSADADTMRVGEYLSRWLPTVRGTVKERTWERHEQVVRLHLEPTIGTIRLCKLNPLDLHELYRNKLDSGLSPRSVQIIHATAHKALKQAVRWRLAVRNVAEDVTRPRVHNKETRTLSREEVMRLLEAAQGTRFETLYVLAVTTGMRQGELLGLQWNDVDMEAGVLRVKRTVWGSIATTPKTAKAIRSIRLTQVAIESLVQQRARDGNWKWIFSTRNGTPLDCHNLIYRSWWPLLEKTGLPKIPFHNLRHTCATLLLTQGVHPKLVQELLGHTDITTTLNTYSHVIPALEGKAAIAMDSILS